MSHILSLGGGPADIPALIGQVRSEPTQPPKARVPEPKEAPAGSGGAVNAREAEARGSGHDPSGAGTDMHGHDTGERLPNGPHGEMPTGPLGEGKTIGPGRFALEPEGISEKHTDVKSLATGPAVERAEAIRAAWARENWLREVEDRCGREEVARIQKALGEVPYTAQDIAIMRAMHMYRGILPEHLPGYLGRVKETMVESPWFGRVVAFSLEFLGLLDQRVEHKKLTALPSRFFDILLNEFYRAAAAYDLNLAQYVDRICLTRKDEFK